MINIEDLLNREIVNINEENISLFLTDKVVLISGGAGSIGSELARQIIKYNPKIIILFDHNENALFFLEKELKKIFPNVICKLGSICNKNTVKSIFKEFKPQIVYHSAAHKHVALSEHNVNQTIYNNVLGTRTIAEAASKYKCESFVMISTDKAVNPTSIMGASKRIAEYYIQYKSKQSLTRFVVVRFGNVLGSSGSVIPIFQKQIENMEPITITHKDVTRFFMTIPEAARLTLQASIFGLGGEIFVLDMGEPIKIIDLAINFIKLHGLEPYKDIDIIVCGLKPGEKMFEELFDNNENKEPTSHSKINKTKNTYVPNNMLKIILELECLCKNSTPNIIRNKLQELIEGAKLQ